MTEPGRYIVLEGDEGAGKTSQLELLRQKLFARLDPPDGVAAAIKLREPGGDPVGEQLREILKHSAGEITPIAQTLGFLMARANMLELRVKPKLAKGTWVLADRSFISTLIYQGHVQGLIHDPNVETAGYNAFLSAVEWVTRIQRPTLMIVLDIPYEVSQQRVAKRDERPDRFESFDAEKRRAINDWYRHYGDPTYARTALVDGNQSIEDVHNQIWAHVEPLLPQEAS